MVADTSFISTGGLIALGLGVKGWDIDHCIEQFNSLCQKAFTPRGGLAMLGIARMIRARNGSIYRTEPLQDALLSIYSDNPLFGGLRYRESPQTKVALVATSAAGLQPVVLSNYNRMQGDEEKSSIPFFGRRFRIMTDRVKEAIYSNDRKSQN